MNLNIKQVERITVDVPFREVPARNMVRELPHWTLFEICRVGLECGVTGFGETMQYYTWGTVSDAAVARVTGTPVWALLGKKIRERPLISWWDIDMPGEDWVLECRQAIQEGYTD